MPMTWNDRADVRLFINVLKIHNVKLDYNALATAMGPDCTAKAIMHRVTKLRSIAAEEEKSGNTGTSTSNPSTPSKARGSRKTNGDSAGKATKGSGGGRKRRANDVEAEDQDDDQVPNDAHEGVKIEADGDDEPEGKRFKTESFEVVDDDGEDDVQEVVDDEDEG